MSNFLHYKDKYPIIFHGQTFISTKETFKIKNFKPPPPPPPTKNIVLASKFPLIKKVKRKYRKDYRISWG